MLSSRTDGLEAWIGDEDNAYFYLETSDWPDLNSAEVAPLATGPNGDTFYLMLSRNEATELVYFTLESGTLKRFSGFDDLVVDILTAFVDDDVTESELQRVASELGYSGAISIADFDI